MNGKCCSVSNLEKFAAFLKDDEVLCYESRLNGKMFARSDLLKYSVEDTTRLLIVTELDLSVIGLGSDRTSDYAELAFDWTGNLLRFKRVSGGKTLSVEFGDGAARIILPDGAVQTVEVSAMDGIVDANLPGLSALTVANLIGDKQREQKAGHVMIASQGIIVPYVLTPEPEARRWSSSFDELFEVDDQGLVLAINLPKQAVRVERVAPRPREELLARVTAIENVGTDQAATRNRVAAQSEPGIAREELAIETGGIAIHAIASWPDGKEPDGLIVFAPGSGPVDRFGLAGNIDTGLRQIADGLSRLGYLTVTADKPGAGKTRRGDDPLDRGFNSVAEEVEGVLAAVMTRPDVRGKGIALVGHSLGGLVVADIAGRRHDIVGAVALLATPGRPIDALIAAQIRWLGERLSLDPAVVDEQVADLERFVSLVRTVKDWREGTVPDRFLTASRSRRWMEELLAIDPADLVRHIRCPLFMGIGTLDVQVSPVADFGRLAEAATTNQHQAVRRCYAGLDHLFKPTVPEAGLTAYSDSSRRVPQEVIADLGDFFHRTLPMS